MLLLYETIDLCNCLECLLESKLSSEINSSIFSLFLNFREHIEIRNSINDAFYSRRLCKFKLLFPSIPEQQKIAAILSEADAKIEKEQTQKDTVRSP